MESFQIIVRQYDQRYRLIVTPKETTSAIERYEVRANNHVFLFECNRPILVARGLQHLSWQWTLVAGTIKSSYFLDEIKTELEKVLRAKYSKRP